MPRNAVWAWTIALLVLLQTESCGAGEVRRVIEVFEPFPFTPDGSRLQLQHALQAVKKVSASWYRCTFNVESGLGWFHA
jgi:hypothetical protein